MDTELRFTISGDASGAVAAIEKTAAAMGSIKTKTQDATSKAATASEAFGSSIEKLGTKVQQFLLNPMEGIKSGMTSFLTSISPLGIAIGGIASVAAVAASSLFKFEVAAAQNAERLQNLSAVTGMSVQQLMAMEQIAKEAGLEGMNLGRMIGKLNQELGQNKANDFTKAAERMGISLSSGGQMKSAIAILDEMRVAFQGIPDPAMRAQAAAQLLPLRLQPLASLLINSKQSLAEMTDEMIRFGVAVSEETQARLLAFDDKMDLLGRVAAAAKVQLTEIVAGIFSFGEELMKNNPKLNVFMMIMARLVGGKTGMDLYNAAVGNTAKQTKELSDAEKDLHNSMEQRMHFVATNSVDEKKRAADLERQKKDQAEWSAIASKAVLAEATMMEKLNAETHKLAESYSDIAVIPIEEVLGLNTVERLADAWETLSRSMVPGIDELNKLQAGMTNVPEEFVWDPNFLANRGEYFNAQIGDIADLQAKSLLEAEANAKKGIENIRDSAGHIFDDLLTGSKNIWDSLLDTFKNFFLAPMRIIFQNFMAWLFSGFKGGFGQIFSGLGGIFGGGGGGGSLGGFDLSKLFGGGGAFATALPFIGGALPGLMGGGGLLSTLGTGLASTFAAGGMSALGTGALTGGWLGTGAGGFLGGGMHAMLGMLTNPITAALMAGVIGVPLLMKAFKGPTTQQAGSKEVMRDLGINVGEQEFAGFGGQFGDIKEMWNIRKDLYMSPKFLAEIAGPAAEAQGRMESFLTSLEQVKTSWGTFNFRKAYELGESTGDWAELNKQFREAFGVSTELQRIIPDWESKLMAVEDPTKRVKTETELLTESITGLRDSIQSSIAPVQSMYEKYMATGEMTDEFRKKITDLGGDIGKFDELSRISKINGDFETMKQHFLDTGEILPGLRQMFVDFGGSLDALDAAAALPGLNKSLEGINSLMGGLGEILPEKTPIEQVLAGEWGPGVWEGLSGMGLDPAKLTKITDLIKTQKGWDAEVADFMKTGKLVKGGVIEQGLYQWGGSAGRTALEKYYAGQNTITGGLLAQTKASIDTAYTAERGVVMAYLDTVKTGITDKIGELTKGVTDQFDVVGKNITDAFNAAKNDVVTVLNQILSQLGGTPTLVPEATPAAGGEGTVPAGYTGIGKPGMAHGGEGYWVNGEWYPTGLKIGGGEGAAGATPIVVNVPVTITGTVVAEDVDQVISRSVRRTLTRGGLTGAAVR